MGKKCAQSQTNLGTNLMTTATGALRNRELTRDPRFNCSPMVLIGRANRDSSHTLSCAQRFVLVRINLDQFSKARDQYIEKVKERRKEIAEKNP